MKSPLNELANRLAQNPAELSEFIHGLILEKDVAPENIIEAAPASQTKQH